MCSSSICSNLQLETCDPFHRNCLAPMSLLNHFLGILFCQDVIILQMFRLGVEVKGNVGALLDFVIPQKQSLRTGNVYFWLFLIKTTLFSFKTIHHCIVLKYSNLIKLYCHTEKLHVCLCSHKK